tara:strand:+ start:2125 stop:3081 length:957 start_codon:yes stop_codon:yes gene_type:complete
LKINNLKIWSITDGSQGMISQTKGLASEISNDVKEIKTDIIFPWNKLQPGLLPVFKWIFKNNIPSNVPDIVISCGRKSVYLSLYLKKKFSNVINIHIQNPKISSKNFSYIVVPNHDNLKGEKILNSIGALHHFKNKNNQKQYSNQIKNKLVSCIIGGENNHYIFTTKEAKELITKIKELKSKNSNLDFLVITSRRTGFDIKKLLKNELNKITKLWLGEGKNPYEFALYNSSYFIITSDSTSMISEASVSGMPIYVYQLPFKRKSIRFERFHNEFKELNITRDFVTTNKFENWSYDKLNESERIAGIIKERIIEGFNES